CGDDTMIGVWNSASRRKFRILRGNGGDQEFGPWVQVGREGLPLFNAALIGVQDQGRYLPTTPATDVANFGPYILFPVIPRDLEVLGTYAALGVPQGTIDTLKGGTDGRLDIVTTVNLFNIPADGCHVDGTGKPSVPLTSTGDVLRLDVATDSQFPNG